MSIKNIWFIRHGESESNAGFATSSHENIELTLNGYQQALITSLSIDFDPDLIVTTKHKRTYQTAFPLLNEKLNTPHEVWPLHEFDYLSPKACENTTVEERKPLVKAFWDRCDPDYVDGQGAESFNQFSERIIQSIKKIEQSHLSLFVIFAHGHVIKRIIQYLSGKDFEDAAKNMVYFRDNMMKIKIDNTQVIKTEYNDQEWLLKN